MKKRLSEETVIFVSILKWTILASVVGVLVGLSSTVFLRLLDLGLEGARDFRYLFLILPVALFSSATLIMRLAPEAEGHGTERVIEAVHKRAGKIPIAVIPVKLVATVITITAGGSAGKEGPCAQIGAGIASWFATLFKFDDHDRRKLVICGISAGFSSVFGTPIAGAIFGVEVLTAGSLLYDVLLPSFIAGIVGHQVASNLGVTYFHYPLKFVPAFSEYFFLEVTLAGLFFGLCALLLIEGLKFGKYAAGLLKFSLPWRGALGGAVLIVLILLTSDRYLGLGLDTIHSTLQGDDVVWHAFLLKVVFTVITLNFGGSGGIITPVFFIGATAGSAYAVVLGLDPSTFSAIGLVSLLAGAANTPIAASIMAVELFGTEVASYAAVACVISFMMTGHRSVYPSQILAIRKSRSIQVELGKTLEHVNLHIRPGTRSLVGKLLGHKK